MILFLDFDGVLHPEPCYCNEDLFCWLGHFESIMRDFPSVDIVVSSTWRETRTLDELRLYFSADIAARIIGVTPDWREVPHLLSVIGSYTRHVEIEGWLRQCSRPWEAWIALDDRHWLFKPFLPNLVRCNPTKGIDDEAAMRLREKLNGAV